MSEIVEIETQVVRSTNSSPHRSWILGVNCFFLIVGSVFSKLLSKFYSQHGGSSVWVITVAKSIGFPLLLPFIFLSPFATHRRPFSGITLSIFSISVGMGLVVGFNNFLGAYGIIGLPVSTSYLLLSPQVVFDLIFKIVIIRECLTFPKLNTIVLLTISYVLLGLDESNDHEDNVSRALYLTGFFYAICANLLPALIYLPVVERVYRRLTSYVMLVEIQVIMEAAATAFAIVGTAVGKPDRRPDVGEMVYWKTLVANVVANQMYLLGTAGTMFLNTSFTRAILTIILTVLNVRAGVWLNGDYFQGMKVLATILCAWGLSSNAFCKYAGRGLRGGACGGEGAGDRGELGGGAECGTEVVEGPEVVVNVRDGVILVAEVPGTNVVEGPEVVVNVRDGVLVLAAKAPSLSETDIEVFKFFF